MKHVVEFEGRIVASCTTPEAAEAALRLMHVDSEKLTWVEPLVTLYLRDAIPEDWDDPRWAEVR